MITRLLICFFLLAAAVSAPGQVHLQSMVIQTDLPVGMVPPIYHYMTSTGLSFSEPFNALVGEKGSVFELWASNAWGLNLTLVDQKTVNVYSPEASITIRSEDPFSRGTAGSLSLVQRTRADRPFGVTVHVRGFVRSGANDMIYMVDRTRFSPLTYGPDPSEPVIPSDPPGSLNDTDQTWDPVYQSLTLPAEDARYACGRQTYGLRWIDPVFGTLGGIDLARVALEIWPMTKVRFEGVTEGHVYVDRLPPVTLGLQHLYPDSKTYLRIYEGAYNPSNTAGTLVSGTERRYGALYNPGTPDVGVPQNYTVVVDDLSNYTPRDGVYTVEVITETPFARDGERLMHLTFEVDRVVSIRGQFSTREPTKPR